MNEKTHIKSTGNNLQVCTQSTREIVYAIFNDPGIRGFAKDTIRAGLDKDCVNAASDSALAARILKIVCDDGIIH